VEEEDIVIAAQWIRGLLRLAAAAAALGALALVVHWARASH
jgi:hypothetical protein